MKQFFYILFGGLLVVWGALGIAYSGAQAWQFAKATIPQPLDGTSISGLVRYIRYSALEEEDALDTTNVNSNIQRKISAVAYIVRNLNRDETAYGLNSDRLLPIASLTKLVTAEVTKRMMTSNERITISREIMSTYGNTADFKEGEIFRADELLYPLLMVSSNDAAEALAQDYGRKKFIRAMNDFTQSIGAYRTYFDDPSGLSEKNVSTASDLAIILDWIHKNDPKLLEITAMKTDTIRGHTWINPTHFLSLSNYLGGKNGYTPEANRTASSLFTLGKNNDLYAVVVLGSDARDSDVRNLLDKVQN